MSRTALIGSDWIGGNSAEASGSSACFAEREEVSSSIFSGIISEHPPVAYASGLSHPSSLDATFLWICGRWVRQFLGKCPSPQQEQRVFVRAAGQFHVAQHGFQSATM